MPENIPSLKVKESIRLLRRGGCDFYRKGKGDHQLYVRYCEGRNGRTIVKENEKIIKT